MDKLINYLLRINFYIQRKLLKGKNLRNSSPLIKPNLILKFNDDFLTSSWTGENRKWIVGEGWGSFHPDNLQCYFAPPEIVDTPEGTFARFGTRYKPKKFNLWGKEIEIPFGVSWLSTTGFFRQKYGRFECRMTLPLGRGSWPAFWLWGPSWPPEIDVIEAYGREDGSDIVVQEINLHYREFDDHNSMGPYRIKIDEFDENITQRFHEFAVEWRPDRIDIFCDGQKIFTYSGENILSYFNSIKGGQHIVVNMNLHQRYPLESAETLNHYFLVDYVRAYAFNDDLI
jgi:hypothetical protein